MILQVNKSAKSKAIGQCTLKIFEVVHKLVHDLLRQKGDIMLDRDIKSWFLVVVMIFKSLTGS